MTANRGRPRPTIQDRLNNNQNQNRSAAPLNMTPVDTLTSRRPVAPVIRSPRERILVMGDSISGKSFAWARRAHREWREAHEAGREPAKFWILDTDDTCSKFVAPGMEFQHLAFNVEGGNVYPFPVDDWESYTASVGAIIRQAKRGDWVVIDVATRVYDFAQWKTAEEMGFNLTDAAFARTHGGGGTPRGFGGLPPEGWNAVNILFDRPMNQLTNNAGLNVFATSHLADIIEIKNRSERREILTIFDQIKFKPRGAPKLHTMVDTILAVWNYRAIDRDGNTVIRAETVRTCKVIKDRGQPVNANLDFDKDLIDSLEDWRLNNRVESVNVTDVKRAREIKDAVENDLHGSDSSEEQAETTSESPKDS